MLHITYYATVDVDDNACEKRFIVSHCFNSGHDDEAEPRETDTHERAQWGVGMREVEELRHSQE